MSYTLERQRPKYTYFDFKEGKCSDIEYFASAYGGTVTKHFDEKDVNKEHPFFLIYREVKEGLSHYYEAKVYDLTRGLIEKKIKTRKISNSLFWNGNDELLGYKDSLYFREYIQFLLDMGVISTHKRTIKRSK